ncbi:hypothetical protein BDV98DRAFT_561767 [Pterulicium gracile]|uniref:Uncharacterized protein n=1 Tax=Pterulicium gracile TaxID=1884261 RepID=A0A5C3QTE8_9AGAR|nr:hypothetical protein BDV98DRAFT_561767 [Pterula gracilis]
MHHPHSMRLCRLLFTSATCKSQATRAALSDVLLVYSGSARDDVLIGFNTLALSRKMTSNTHRHTQEETEDPFQPT